MPWPLSTGLCRCGHLSEAHEHYRRGTDCALCDCARYRTTFTFARAPQQRSDDDRPAT